jgi:chromosome partitioning protein
MKIIVPTNNKGGVGKTKVSMILAEYFSYVCKKKTLVIDFDPQCNLSRRLIKMELDPSSPQGYYPPLHPDYNPEDSEEDPSWDGRSSIANIFFGRPVIPYPTFIKNLDVAPANADQLLLAEAVRRTEVAEKVHKQMHKFLSGQDVQEAYEVVIIDTAPSKGPLTISAIKAASHIIIPSIMEAQPIQGIYGMMQLWMQEALAREQGRAIKLVGILPNMFRQNNLHKDMLESLKNNSTFSKYIMPISLGLRVALAEVDTDDALPRSIFDLNDRDLAKQEAIKFCEFVEQRVFKDE